MSIPLNLNMPWKSSFGNGDNTNQEISKDLETKSILERFNLPMNTIEENKQSDGQTSFNSSVSFKQKLYE